MYEWIIDGSKQFMGSLEDVRVWVKIEEKIYCEFSKLECKELGICFEVKNKMWVEESELNSS